MFRSAVLVLVGFTSITAPVEGGFDIIQNTIGSINSAVLALIPCPGNSDPPGYTYRCSGKSVLTLTHCCSLGEWLLNDGLLTMCLSIVGILVVIMLIFCCPCCSCIPGNRYHIRIVQPQIYQSPHVVHVQPHFSQNHGIIPASREGYLPQHHDYEQK